MQRDHQFFICGYYPDRNLAPRRRDASSFVFVSRRVDFNPQPGRRFRYSPANLRRVLTNAGSEYERIDAAQDRGERSNLFGDAIDEIIDGEPGFRLFTPQQVAHVITYSGTAERS